MDYEKDFRDRGSGFMNISNYYGWIGIIFFILWLISAWYLEPEIIKGKEKIKFKYYREFKGILIFLAGLFISFKAMKWDPGGYIGPGEWGFFFVFWSIVIILGMTPTIIQKKINKITGKKSKTFEVFYKWLWLIPGYYCLISLFIFKDSNHSFFNLDKAVNFLGIEEGTALMIGLALIFVAGFHFISVVIKFFSEKF